MDQAEVHRELQASPPLEGHAADLRLGNRRIRVVGLTPRRLDLLERRWGDFLEPAAAADPALTLRLVRPIGAGWIPWARPGEGYRLEASGTGEQRVVGSYNFMLTPAGPRTWLGAVRDSDDEPPGRVMDNVMRYLTAVLTTEAGGVPLHGAGVLHGQRAWIFAGPSGSGKTTASTLSGAPSLGDDFAVVLPGRLGWLTLALPFDNAECIEHRAPRGVFPLAGILRVAAGTEHAIDVPPAIVASVSLMGCVAFPWALPGAGDGILQAVSRLIRENLFAHLKFRRDPQFWTDLVLRGAD